jgi:outer membrane protein assembly factor BamB
VVLPHVYVQSLAIDAAGETLYCLCFAPEYLASYNLKTGEVKNLGLLGSGYGGMTQGENIVLDDRGCVWSNWSLTRAWQDGPGPDAARLCKYDPREDRVTFCATGLPRPDGSPGYAPGEAFFNFGDGWLYASGANGSFYRIDPTGGEAESLFTPTPDRPSRLSSLVRVADGVAYGVTGRGGNCELMRVYYKEGRFEKLGPMIDSEGRAMYQCHDIMATGDGVLYACENDNPYRSSYLWEIHPRDGVK